MASPDLTSVAVYRRRVRASLERVWENVFDWEHLPWLHHESFARITLMEEGSWGWRARIALRGEPAPEIVLGLLVEREASRYVARTEEGMGEGTEIWTQLAAVGSHATDIEVDFRVPGVEPSQRAAVGAGYTALYTRLWDQDEAMMLRRTELLARENGSAPSATETLDLGEAAALESQLPLCVEAFGRRLRVVRVDGELRVHDTICPHLLGPLEEAAIEDGCVVCPWHGYRFDLATGRESEGRRLRMRPPPRIECDPESGRVRLVRTAGAPAGEAS